MTASLFVTGTHAARAGRDEERVAVAADVVHAVARPVVDGLESAVCGLLVTARATDDWETARPAARCPECARIAG